MAGMEIQGYDAAHFLGQAAQMLEESGDSDICPDAAAQARYVALAQVEALIGLALVIGGSPSADTADPRVRQARTSRQGIDLTVNKIGERR